MKEQSQTDDPTKRLAPHFLGVDSLRAMQPCGCRGVISHGVLVHSPDCSVFDFQPRQVMNEHVAVYHESVLLECPSCFYQK